LSRGLDFSSPHVSNRNQLFRGDVPHGPRIEVGRVGAIVRERQILAHQDDRIATHGQGQIKGKKRHGGHRLHPTLVPLQRLGPQRVLPAPKMEQGEPRKAIRNSRIDHRRADQGRVRRRRNPEELLQVEARRIDARHEVGFNTQGQGETQGAVRANDHGPILISPKMPKVLLKAGSPADKHGGNFGEPVEELSNALAGNPVGEVEDAVCRREQPAFLDELG
jgi:hypothetical protein